jgi:hypothetical protein
VDRVFQLACGAVLVTALLAGTATASTRSIRMSQLPLRLGCPGPSERVGARAATVGEAIAIAERVLYRQLTHFLGRREQRNTVNTPVFAVVNQLGLFHPKLVPGLGALLARATRRCGAETARFSSAVLFTDSLNIVCCLPPITLFVVRTDRSWRVYQPVGP